ncbi:MAG: M16 family metallopeptidase, partial [Steroidobacterales bacterium]
MRVSAALALWVLISTCAEAGLAERVERAMVAGMQVFAYRTAVEDEVIIRGALPAGDVFSAPANPAVATLVAGMLDKGTETYGKFEIAQKLAEVGATISFSAEEEVVTFQVRTLKSDLPLVLSILAQELRSPAFQQGELDKFKVQLTGALRRDLDETDVRATEALNLLIYPMGHPNRPATLERLIAGVQAATVDDLRRFHVAHYGPSHL